VAIAKLKVVRDPINALIIKNCQRIVKLFFVLGLISGLMMVSLEGSWAQDRLEVGPLIGASYYFGDLNPGTPFSPAHLAYGGLGRYVFNDRLALKGTAVMAGVSGKYNAEKGSLPGVPLNYAFNRRVGDVALQMEINLFSYDHKYISTTVFTPYLSVGLGSTIYKRSGDEGEKSVFVLSLPFGAGVKYKLNKWVRVGAEWSFRKMFVDDLEGNMVSEPYPDFYGQTWTHNNDWYSIVGVYVTVNFLKRRDKCNGGY
jgi:hypothetical protein